MLNNEQRTSLVKKINEQLDIPWVPESTEAALIRTALDYGLDAFEEYLPEDWQAAMQDASLELAEGDVDGMERVMKDEINERIDLPLFDEAQEAVIIEAIWSLVKVGTKAGWTAARIAL